MEHLVLSGEMTVLPSTALTRYCSTRGNQQKLSATVAATSSHSPMDLYYNPPSKSWKPLVRLAKIIRIISSSSRRRMAISCWGIRSLTTKEKIFMLVLMVWPGTEIHISGPGKAHIKQNGMKTKDALVDSCKTPIRNCRYSYIDPPHILRTLLSSETFAYVNCTWI